MVGDFTCNFAEENVLHMNNLFSYVLTLEYYLLSYNKTRSCVFDNWAGTYIIIQVVEYLYTTYSMS